MLGIIIDEDIDGALPLLTIITVILLEVAIATLMVVGRCCHGQ